MTSGPVSHTPMRSLLVTLLMRSRPPRREVSGRLMRRQTVGCMAGRKGTRRRRRMGLGARSRAPCTAALEHDDERVLVTIDTDFGNLVFAQGLTHSGLLQLPDVPAVRRIELTQQVLEDFGEDLANGAIVTIKGGRIRISRRE